MALTGAAGCEENRPQDCEWDRRRDCKSKSHYILFHYAVMHVRMDDEPQYQGEWPRDETST